jgi:elongator complex protein 3
MKKSLNKSDAKIIKKYIKEVIKFIKNNNPSKDDLSRFKIKLCSKYHIKQIPNDIQIMMSLSSKDLIKFKKYLSIKETRNISGVSVVAIMTKPLECPGTCIYCPGGVNSFYGDTPKSYTGKEPAARRAARNHFDPYLQIFNRLEHYVVSGHVPDKIELIIMGATFPAFDKQYQDEFIYYSYKALNDFSNLFYDRKGLLKLNKFRKFFELPANVKDELRTKKLHSKILDIKKKSIKKLNQEQEINEKVKCKCVGLTIETRPDYGTLSVGNNLLRYGTTRIELGVQTVYDDILKRIKRGHDLSKTVESVKVLRDLGFKLNFHMMPGLPEVDKKRDLEGLKKLFNDERFQPDMLKLYPCMVMPGTELYQLYKKGKFSPLTTKGAADLISDFKKFVPRYVRIMRVQRDIPSKLVFAGVDKTNLRQYVDKKLKSKNIKCNCIRCREIKSGKIHNPELNVIQYDAAKGKEFFISIDDEESDKIIGFCRLRFPGANLRKEFVGKTAIIRELHVYGKTTAVGNKSSKNVQHHGFGKILMGVAEIICKDYNYSKLLVISGVGVRRYYAKLGYSKEGPYMSKKI